MSAGSPSTGQLPELLVPPCDAEHAVTRRAHRRDGQGSARRRPADPRRPQLARGRPRVRRPPPPPVDDEDAPRHLGRPGQSPRGRLRRETIDLKRQALLIANIARWAALSVGSPALQTQERLRAAAGSRMMTAEDADTLVDVFEIVQHVRLRHQLEAVETPSDTMRLRVMSTIEASVLGEANREIVAIQRRMATREPGALRNPSGHRVTARGRPRWG
jgi:hypothetical protein